MFGTRLINSTVVTAMMITFVLIMIVLFILFIKDIGRNINCNYIGDKYAYSYDWYQDI